MKIRRFIAVTMLVLFGLVSAQDLVVYSSVDETNARAILQAFTEQTGVRVQAVFLSSGPALSRIEAERARPQADVWFGAPSENHIIARSRGLTQAYRGLHFDALISEFKDPEGFWHAIYTNPLAVGVRTDILAQRGVPVPTSWADLTNPIYRGLIQLPSPQSSGTAYNAVLTWIDIFGEEGAFDYMARLNDNVQTYTQSGTAPSAALGVGETAIAIQFSPGFLKLIDEGFPVAIFFPSEGVGYEVPGISILQGAQHLEASKKLVDWITSPAGQQALSNQKTYFLPIRADVSAGAGVPTLDQIALIAFDSEYAASNRQRLLDLWGERVLGQ